MNRPDELVYYASRARQARAMAKSASDSAARCAHEEMAKRYHAMVERIAPQNPAN